LSTRTLNFEEYKLSWNCITCKAHNDRPAIHDTFPHENLKRWFLELFALWGNQRKHWVSEWWKLVRGMLTQEQEQKYLRVRATTFLSAPHPFLFSVLLRDPLPITSIQSIRIHSFPAFPQCISIRGRSSSGGMGEKSAYAPNLRFAYSINHLLSQSRNSYCIPKNTLLRVLLCKRDPRCQAYVARNDKNESEVSLIAADCRESHP
jgi:hypothetical protein